MQKHTKIPPEGMAEMKVLVSVEEAAAMLNPWPYTRLGAGTQERATERQSWAYPSVWPHQSMST